MLALSLLPSIALLARGEEWIFIALASFAVWVYNQIKKAGEEQAKKQAKPPQPDAAPPPPRAGQSGAPPRRQQPPVRQRQASRPAQPARPALSDRPSLTSTQSPEGDAWAKPEAVASHVHHHLDTQEFEQRSGSLGQLSHLSSGVDEHVHEAFDHEVRTINDQGEVTEGDAAGEIAPPVVSAATAAGIGDLFADPENLRNAIILQEVLRLPKWE